MVKSVENNFSSLNLIQILYRKDRSLGIGSLSARQFVQYKNPINILR